MVWVSCEGENPADVENIGVIQYYPQRGFPSFYFPYLNVQNYLPPLVAIYFESPRSKYNCYFKDKSVDLSSFPSHV